jgi:hypothetical protein
MFLPVIQEVEPKIALIDCQLDLRVKLWQNQLTWHQQ